MEENDIKNFCLELDFEVQSSKLGISKLEEKFSDLNLDLKCNINKSNNNCKRIEKLEKDICLSEKNTNLLTDLNLDFEPSNSKKNLELSQQESQFNISSQKEDDKINIFPKENDKINSCDECTKLKIKLKESHKLINLLYYFISILYSNKKSIKVLKNYKFNQ